MDPAHLMARALRLAERGRGTTSPNPSVGCVVARDGRIVGEGFHREPGLPHAEVEAIAAAGEAARGADLYVNLEPCCHFGRTPPCTRRIIESGVRRVFASVRDPNPLVSGRGIAELESAGIGVQTGLLAAEAARVNAPYFKWIRTGLPYVTLKWAMSLDGKVAARGARSGYITGEAALRRVHELRSRVDAIAVGVGTVLKDDPELTVRHVSGRSPDRVVFDSALRIPLDSHIVSRPDPPVTVVTAEGAPAARRQALESRGLRVLEVPALEGRVDMASAMRALGSLDVTHLLVEGGPTVHGTFRDLGLADHVIVLVAPVVLGGADVPSAVAGLGAASPSSGLALEVLATETLGEDLLIEARPKEAMSDVHRDREAPGDREPQRAV